MNTYIAHVDGVETEEMTFDDLKFLALSRKLPSETPVRLANDPAWLTWGEIPALQMRLGKTRAHYARPFSMPSVTVKRDVVRSVTAYPFLRLFGKIMIGLSVAVAVIAWGAVIFSSDESRTGLIPVAILSSLGIPGTIFTNGVAQAIIDIADCLLNRKEQTTSV